MVGNAVVCFLKFRETKVS